LLTSIRNNTANIGAIEVLIAVDEDDVRQNAVIDRNQFPFAKFYKVKRSLNFSKDYYNFLCSKSTGRWVIACNDDAEFITKHWDVYSKQILENKIGNAPNIIYGWIEDMLGPHRLNHLGNYCCFPLQGRDGINALGYFFPPTIPTWGADIFLEQLYRNVGKIIHLPIVIKHISIHNGLRQPDEIYKRIAMNQVACNINPTPDQINTLIAAIRAGHKECLNA
jgi:hypothetical protein